MSLLPKKYISETSLPTEIFIQTNFGSLPKNIAFPLFYKTVFEAYKECKTIYNIPKVGRSIRINVKVMGPIRSRICPGPVVTSHDLCRTPFSHGQFYRIDKIQL